MNSMKINAKTYLSLSQPLTTVDLRSPAEIDKEYLAGCIALPVQEFNEQALASNLTAQGYKSGPIYLLCQSGRRAELAIEKLKGSHQYPLVIIEGGLNALKQAGAGVQSRGGSIISLERQVRISAGALVVLSSLLGSTIHPAFYGIGAFVGAGLIFAGATDSCGMAMVLARMPWNQIGRVSHNTQA